MDKREARQYTSSNPPADPFFYERRPSFLGRLFSRSRSNSASEDGNGTMPMGLTARRGSIDPPDVTSLTQKVQQEMKKPAVSSNEFSIFT